VLAMPQCQPFRLRASAHFAPGRKTPAPAQQRGWTGAGDGDCAGA
jgi:hypothetical protein